MRPLAVPARVVRQRWRLLLVLALCAGGAALAGPRLRAWYHLRAARAALARYHNAEARSHLDISLACRPDHAEAHLLAARAARRAEAFDEAEEHLFRYDALRPQGSPESVLEWAMLRAAMGDLGRVEEFLLDQVPRSPGAAPLIWEALAAGYVRMYRILEAIACLDRWLSVQPDNVQALFLRGEARRKVHQVQAAVADYRRVVELDPGREEARRWLGIFLLEIGRYEEALGHLESLRRQDPDDPELSVHLARCRDKLGQTDAAVRLLDAVLAGHPGNGPALRERGRIALRAGEQAEAEGWLRQAVAAAPFDYPAAWALYQCLEGQGKTAEAREQLARAQQLKDRQEQFGEVSTRLLSVRPHDPALHVRMGTLLIGLGYEDVGRRWLLSALGEDPGYAPAHAALADYYETRGDTAQAARHRQQAQAGAAAVP